ncbi:MAG: TetR/AcrR family transcriptional regulator [Spirochaetales bacterium]|nr:TetR/AcrR family transcriptional regulator [Spirochaetales bacterium]
MPKQTFYNLNFEKQQKIFSAALSLFSNLRYDQISIDKIVFEAGIPKGSFYQYFSGKDDLFKYIFKDIGKVTTEKLLEKIEKSIEVDFIALIMELLNFSQSMLAENPELLLLKKRFLEECPQSVKNQILSEFQDETDLVYSTLLQKCIEQKIVSQYINLELSSKLLSLISLNIEKFSSPSTTDFNQLTIDLLSVVYNGLKP